MKRLMLSRPTILAVVVLLIAQMACGLVFGPSTAAPKGTAKPATSTQTTGSSASTQTSGSSATQAPGIPQTGGTSAATQLPTALPPTSAQGTQVVPPTSSGPGSITDPQAMLQAVAQHYQAVGRQQALSDFTNKTPPFDNSDMFVMCIGSDHTITAMGGFPMLVGVSADTLKDPTGHGLGQLVWDAVSIAPQGSVPFPWKNPLSGAAESKVLFYQKLSQDVCGVMANNQ